MRDPAPDPTPDSTVQDPSLPQMRCLRDIMNDEHYTKYSEYSEIYITIVASLSGSASPQFRYKYAPLHLDHKPPPISPYIHIVDVYAHEYEHNERMTVGTPYISNHNHIPPPIVKNTNYHL